MRYFAVLFTLFAFFSVTSSANAASSVVVLSISGASASSVPTTGSTDPIFYGALAGDDSPAGADCNSGSLSSSAFCNTCIDEETSCSKRRIHDELKVTITFKYTGDTAGEVLLGYIDGSTNTDIDTDDYDRSTTTISKNQTASISIEWGLLCSIMSQLDNTTDCISIRHGGAGSGPGIDVKLLIAVGDIDTEASRATVNVDIREPDFTTSPDIFDAGSDDDAGISVLNVVAGDEKVYIEPTTLRGTCPGTNDITKFRVFFSEDSFDEAGYDSARYADLDIDSSCNPSGDWLIDGLQNDIPYFFRIASVDVAGNVAFLTNIDVPTGDELFDAGNQPGCATSTDITCTYIATPGNILGLLPEDLNCFVATAAYGSPFHPIIKILRQFRDQVLKPTVLGRAFIKKYYAEGPKAAHWIANKPIVRSLVRFGLLPFTGAAWIALYYGPWGLAILFVVSIYGLLVVSQKYRSQKIRVHTQDNAQNRKKEGFKK